MTELLLISVPMVVLFVFRRYIASHQVMLDNRRMRYGVGVLGMIGAVLSAFVASQLHPFDENAIGLVAAIASVCFAGFTLIVLITPRHIEVNGHHEQNH